MPLRPVLTFAEVVAPTSKRVRLRRALSPVQIPTGAAPPIGTDDVVCETCYSYLRKLVRTDFRPIIYQAMVAGIRAARTHRDMLEAVRNSFSGVQRYRVWQSEVRRPARTAA